MKATAAVLGAGRQNVTALASTTRLLGLAGDAAGAAVRFLVEIGTDSATTRVRLIAGNALRAIRSRVGTADTVGARWLLAEVGIVLAGVATPSAVVRIGRRIDATPVAAGQTGAALSLRVADTAARRAASPVRAGLVFGATGSPTDCLAFVAGTSPGRGIAGLRAALVII